MTDAPLYHQYKRQTSAQPAYLELDCRTGKIRVDYNAEIGNAVPFDVYHGHGRRYSIPNNISQEQIDQLLEQVGPLAERVADGYESVWSGNNHIAKLDDDALEAEEEIERICNEVEGELNVCDAETWLFSAMGVNDFWTDQDIDDVVEQIMDNLPADVAISGEEDAVRESLLNQAKCQFEMKPEECTTTQARELLLQGELTADEVAAWALDRLEATKQAAN